MERKSVCVIYKEREREKARRTCTNIPKLSSSSSKQSKCRMKRVGESESHIHTDIGRPLKYTRAQLQLDDRVCDVSMIDFVTFR